MKFTKETRRKIVQEFATRHNGVFNPRLFLEDVKRTGPEHPAYGWFTWDDAEAAEKHRVEQARDFASGLRIKFEVEEIRPQGVISVRVVEAPLLISPTEARANGGGYVLTDPRNPDHIRELCRQAAKDLRSWAERYSSVLSFAGMEIEELSGAALRLEEASKPEDEPEAA